MSKTGKYSSSWTWLQKINRRWNEIIRNICSPLWFQMINSQNVGIFRKKNLEEIGSFCGLWYPWFWTWVCPSVRGAFDTQVFGLRVWPDFGSLGWTLILHAHSPHGCCIRKTHPHLVSKKYCYRQHLVSIDRENVTKSGPFRSMLW